MLYAFAKEGSIHYESSEKQWLSNNRNEMESILNVIVKLSAHRINNRTNEIKQFCIKDKEACLS